MRTILFSLVCWVAVTAANSSDLFAEETELANPSVPTDASIELQAVPAALANSAEAESVAASANATAGSAHVPATASSCRSTGST